MRLIKISAPEGKGEDIIKLAFSVGLREVSLTEADVYTSDGAKEKKDVVDIQTSTNKAKDFTDALLRADLYDPDRVSISTRVPHSIVSKDSIRKLTWPLVVPLSDILEELWQFSHITAGFIGRIFIGGGLLAFGMIKQQVLIIVAALLFMPLLPLLLAISFGVTAKQYKLARQGALTFLLALVILVTAGMAVAAITQPPLRYDEFNSLSVGMLISLAVGIAAVLAAVDDAGRRELIGLAATSQIAIVPVWLGINFVFGFSPTLSKEEIYSRAGGLVLNALMIIVASAAAYIVCGCRPDHRLKTS